MTTEEARLQRALRDAEGDRDNERRRAEVAESKARDLVARVTGLETALAVAETRGDEMQEALDEHAADTFFDDVCKLVPWSKPDVPERHEVLAILADMAREATAPGIRVPGMVTGAAARQAITEEHDRGPWTPREREPAVWASAFGAAFVAAYLDAVSATDGQGDERTERALADVHVARCRRIADAAVLSLEASR